MSSLANFKFPAQVQSAAPALPQPAPRGVQWLDVKMAAFRAGLTEQQIRNLCEQWASRGLARMEMPAEGGKPRWQIREDADPRLARHKFPEQMKADVRDLAVERQAELKHNFDLYTRWLEIQKEAVRKGESKKAATAAFLAVVREEGTELSEATLYRWHQAYRRDGMQGLLDRRWLGRDRAPNNDPMLDEATRLYLGKTSLTIRQIFELAEQAAFSNGWRVWSYMKVYRHLMSLNPGTRIYAREGKDAFNDMAASYLERDYSTIDGNDIWVSDHHRCDFFVSLPGGKINRQTGEQMPRVERPWLTVWMDMRSRKIVGHYLYVGDPSSDEILLAFRQAVKKYGVPKAVMIDNGRDFASATLTGRTKKERREARQTQLETRELHGTFPLLNVQVHHSTPYHPQAKPVERWFRTFKERCSNTFETYAGGSPEEKPAWLQKRLEAGKAPTLQLAKEIVSTWIETDYNNREHQGHGMEGQSPNTVYTANLHEVRTADESMLDLFMQKHSRPVRVGRNGVLWRGVRYGCYEMGLKPYLGQKVLLRVDPDDVKRVTVWTLEGRFICAAEANTRLPANATAEDLRKAIAEQKRDHRLSRQYHEDVRPRLSDDLPARVARAAEERAARESHGGDNGPLPPPIYVPIRSPIEDDLAAYKFAVMQPVELRKAVGSMPDVWDVLEASASQPRLSLTQELDGEGGAA